MTKSKTKISVYVDLDGKTGCDGCFCRPDCKQVSAGRKIYLVKEEDFRYTVDKVPDNRIPSGLCG